MWLFNIFQSAFLLIILKQGGSATSPPTWNLDSRVITDTFTFIPSSSLAFNELVQVMYPIAATVAPIKWPCFGIIGFNYLTSTNSINLYLNIILKTSTYLRLNVSST